MNVGTRIKRARENKGLTQRGLADHLGVTSTQVSRWERGVAEPSLSRLLQIALLTDASMASFFAEGEKEKVA